MGTTPEDFIDSDGDGIRLRLTSVSVRLSRIGGGPYAGLPREEVLRLYNALGDWLGQAPVKTAQNLTEDRVRQLIVEALKPTVQTLQARYEDAGAGFCRIPGCMRFPHTEKHFEHEADPEPLCGCCHHRNDLHDGTDGCLFGSEGGSEICGCTAQRDPEPRDVGHPEPEPLCDRLIPAGAHFASRCTFCGWLWLQHKPTGVLCRLCQAPWTDGHGQPGDPCAGAPRQLVGCVCGHRWGAHGPHGCMAPYGDSYNPDDLLHCECTRTPPQVQP